MIAGTLALVALLLLTAIAPYDRLTWFFEVLPVIIALPVLWLSHGRFPLTRLLYVLIFIHAIVLIVGGHYTYARVPLGDHLAELFELSRNPYDKLGHFLQGLVPALIAREIFIRTGCVRGNGMVMLLSICVAMAFSACYELIEWAAALIMGQGADEFLGTQGDEWDTQSDMFMALIGSLVSTLCLRTIHDRQLPPATQQPIQSTLQGLPAKSSSEDEARYN